MNHVSGFRTTLVTSLLMIVPIFANAGGAGPGGGEGIAAQYSRVSDRAISAVKLICSGLEDPSRGTIKACSYIAAARIAINKMNVVPRSRDTVLGTDGKPRDAGNDNYQTVFLDVDRWSDKQNETDSNKILDARAKQVALSLHEPLVLVGAEKNDEYAISNKYMDLLSKNNFSLDALVGKPAGNTPNTNIENNIFTANSATATCTQAFLIYPEQFNEQFGSVRLKATMEKEAIDAAEDQCYQAHFEVCTVVHTTVATAAVNCAQPVGFVMKATVRGLHTR
jgi:hypothetical protein